MPRLDNPLIKRSLHRLSAPVIFQSSASQLYTSINMDARSISSSYFDRGSITTTTRSGVQRRGTARPKTARPRTGVSTVAGIESQQIVCALSESRGVSPTVGLAFVNLDTCEVILCEICDSQTYVRTMHKLHVLGPSEILIITTAAEPKSKLFAIIEESLLDLDSTITLLDRKFWAETSGWEYINQLAFPDDLDTIKISIAEKYFTVCCIAAVSNVTASCATDS